VAPTLAHALFVDDPAALAATSEYLERLRGQPHGVCEHFVSRLRELTATIPLSVAIVDTTDTASVQSKTTGVKKASAPTGQLARAPVQTPVEVLTVQPLDEASKKLLVLLELARSSVLQILSSMSDLEPCKCLPPRAASAGGL
jgi:hypothetical protein